MNPDGAEHAEPAEKVFYRAGGLPVDVHRAVFYLAAVLHSMSCGGAFFGWVNLQSMLEAEGVYADQCPGGPLPCPAQTLALNTLYTACSVVACCRALCVGRHFRRGCSS